MEPAALPASESRVAAIISLLDDRSEKVSAASRDALVALGEPVLPALSASLVRAGGRRARRLRSAMAQIRFPAAEQDLLQHLHGVADLESGSLLVARLFDGGPGPEEAAAVLDAMATRVETLLAGDDEPWRQLNVLRRVLSREQRLAGVPPGRARPVHALLHGVTTRRRGMPLPLCMTWLAVARRTGIPLVGVNMPGHFLLRLDVPDKLLVFDAFHGGALVDRSTCERQLQAHQLPASRLTQLDADDTEILLRTLRNLTHLAAADGDGQLVQRCQRVLARARVRPSGGSSPI